MILFLIFFIIIGIWITLFGRSSMSTYSRNSNRRRTYWPDQSSPTSIEPTNPGHFNTIPDASSSHPDTVSYSHTSPSNYSVDSPVASMDNSVNTGSVDSGSSWDSGSSVDVGGSSDFGGFGGGGDFGGGGSGGDWSSSSNSE